MTIGHEASIGTSSFAVVNPDQVFGAGTGLFAVTVPTDVDPPLISAATAESVESTTARITWITDEPADGQVLYRVRTRVDYQAAATEEVMVTDHSATLTGLKPSTDYRFYVTSADTAGNVSTSAEVSFETEPNDWTYLTFEAEMPTIEAPLETGTDTAAFQGEWLGLTAESPTGTPLQPSGIADYSFYVPTAGTWTVWIRVFAPHPAADTLFASVDGAALEAVVAREVGIWHWVEASNYALSAGQHTLALGGGTAETRADRILITDDTDFLPTEQPERNTLPPHRATGLTATTSATAVRLGWTLSPHPDVRRVIVRYRADGTFPTNAVDGLPLLDEPSSAGAVGLLIHEGLDPGTTLHYAVFGVDGAGNVSLPAILAATTANSSTGGNPPPPPSEDSPSGGATVFRYSSGGP